MVPTLTKRLEVVERKQEEADAFREAAEARLALLEQARTAVNPEVPSCILTSLIRAVLADNSDKELVIELGYMPFEHQVKYHAASVTSLRPRRNSTPPETAAQSPSETGRAMLRSRGLGDICLKATYGLTGKTLRCNCTGRWTSLWTAPPWTRRASWRS